MTIQSVKAVFLKATTAALVAGALLVAAPKAQAQQFAVGVQFGAPAYSYNDRPAYGYNEGYDSGAHRRWEREQAELARREAWIQHEQWERHEAWEHRDGWDRHNDWNRQDGYDRDRRDFNGYPPRAVPYNGWR